MVAKHQLVLANLLSTHPNSTGLMRAYNNSVELEEKFREKTRVRFERMMNRNNTTMADEGKHGFREQQIDEVRQESGRGMDDSRGRNRLTATPTIQEQQTVQTTATTAPEAGIGNHGRGNAGNDNSASGGGNGNSGNAGGSSGNGKNH
jgi:hypothetical protein